MSVFVHYDAQSGAIKGFYPASLTYTDVPEPNVEISTGQHMAAISSPGVFVVDLDTLLFTTAAPPPELEQLQAHKLKHLEQLKTQCEAQIRGGWVSDALGSDHLYDTDKDRDQLNLTGAGLAGQDIPFTCTEVATGIKSQKLHTGQQIAAVYMGAAGELVRLLGVLDALRAAVNAVEITTTLDVAKSAVDAIVWTG